MADYFVRRALQSLVVIWALLTVTFLLSRLTGDPVFLYLDQEERANPEIVAEVRRRLGLDEPLTTQYARFLVSAAQGDFGESLRHQTSAIGLVLERLPATVQLATASLLLAIILGVPAGTIAALRALKRDRVLESTMMVSSLLGQSAPGFWLGLMLMYVFAVRLQWLPVSGYGEPQHVILPALAIALRPAATFTRLTRAGLLEVMTQDYITVARSKGLPEQSILFGHAFKNAAIPLVTAIALSYGRLLGGTVVIETVFAWPGMGRFAVQAVFNRDFPVVQAAVFVGGFFFIVINFLTDLLYVYLDPRIRY